MGVQREIWVNYIVEKLFKDDEFIKRAFNESENVLGGAVVHIPQAGAKPTIVKNRTSFPATVQKRTDTDITYALDWYTSDPIRIQNVEQVELSYDKIDSVLRSKMSTMRNYIADDLLVKWLTGAVANSRIVLTTGEGAAATETGQDGNRKIVTTKDIKRIGALMNKQDIPKNDRVIVMESNMLDQLTDSLTENQNRDFSQYMDGKTGVIGKLHGFEIMDRSSVGVINAANDTIDPIGAAVATDDNLCSIAFQRDSVAVALGEVDFFDSLRNPEHYGDIFSTEARMGGRVRRENAEGVFALVQDTAA